MWVLTLWNSSIFFSSKFSICPFVKIFPRQNFAPYGRHLNNYGVGFYQLSSEDWTDVQTVQKAMLVPIFTTLFDSFGMYISRFEYLRLSFIKAPERRDKQSGYRVVCYLQPYFYFNMEYYQSYWLNQGTTSTI